MLSFLRCIMCCEDEVQYEPQPDDHGESLFTRVFKGIRQPSSDYHPIPRYYETYPSTISPTSYGSSIRFSPQTTTRILSENTCNSSNFPQKSRIPSVHDQQSHTQPKTVKVDSGSNPKKSPNLFHNSSSSPYKVPPFESKLPPASSKASASLSGLPPSLPKLDSSSSSSFNAPQTSAKPPPTSNKPPYPSYAPQTSAKPPSVSNKTSSSFNAPQTSAKPPSVSNKPSSSFSAPQTSAKPPPTSNKPILSVAPFNPTTQQTTSNYKWVEKGATPLYVIPEDIKGLIKRDIVPEVLKKPLSPSTYKDYFAALLHAEDYYLEKWDGFEMENVTLELHKAEIHGRKGTYKNRNKNNVKDDKIFVEFEMDSIPERRPFLLSRDFASVRPSGSKVEPFQGIIYRVVKSTLVLVEFGDDFHAQHYSASKYDVKFSFNRVCLKRAHQAIAAVSDVKFPNFLFPDFPPKSILVRNKILPLTHSLDSKQLSALRWILSLKSPPPYLVEGPPSVSREKQLSRTGLVILEAVHQLCNSCSPNRILICAPLNSTCDVFLRSLKKYFLKSEIFRANAAFRELDGVPSDILPFCPYKDKEECFSCPALKELEKFKVILSTYMSTFRLQNEGLRAGHFSHIFLVDASSATEPETMVPLTNLADEKTAVVITGAPGDHSGWVRSDIARHNGLRRSYFERLRERKMYENLNPEFITNLDDVGRKSDGTYSSSSF